MILRRALTPNFGDDLSSELVKLISGKSPINVNHIFKNPNKETIYMTIGSILGWSTPETIVWGSGFISDSFKASLQVFITPKQICAVRGPLTREILLKNGVDCPEIYGDPALLMPRFYNPKLEKKYRLSIIPHHVDKVLFPQLKARYPDAHFIDIQQDIYKFIDEVVQSENIISSALHGIIIADAYNIPNKWEEFSSKVIGHGFKFRDYFASRPYIDLDKLYEACPFRRDE